MVHDLVSDMVSTRTGTHGRTHDEVDREMGGGRGTIGNGERNDVGVDEKDIDDGDADIHSTTARTLSTPLRRTAAPRRLLCRSVIWLDVSIENRQVCQVQSGRLSAT